ncbi:hypothetical protein [Thalassospira lucentensis]|uniref:hypothetical protein n=1 Tax=Thalassospira lucentensis TaxID=168935 RepID=UPI003AA86619
MEFSRENTKKFLYKNHLVIVLSIGSFVVICTIFSVLYFSVSIIENIHNLYITDLKVKKDKGGYDLGNFVTINIIILFIVFVFQKVLFSILRKVSLEIKGKSYRVWIYLFSFCLCLICFLSILSFSEISVEVLNNKPIVSGILGGYLERHFGTIDIWLPMGYGSEIAFVSPLVSVIASWFSVFLVVFGFMATFRPKKRGTVAALASVFRAVRNAKVEPSS